MGLVVYESLFVVTKPLGNLSPLEATNRLWPLPCHHLFQLRHALLCGVQLLVQRVNLLGAALLQQLHRAWRTKDTGSSEDQEEAPK